jgi:hypothetical protein
MNQIDQAEKTDHKFQVGQRVRCVAGGSTCGLHDPPVLGQVYVVTKLVHGSDLELEGMGASWNQRRFEPAIADPCAACGAEACDSPSGYQTTDRFGRSWRLCLSHWLAPAGDVAAAIHERHIKPKEQQKASDDREVCLCRTDRGPRRCPEHGVRCKVADCDKLCDGIDAWSHRAKAGDPVIHFCSKSCLDRWQAKPVAEQPNADPYLLARKTLALKLDSENPELDVGLATRGKPRQKEAREKLVAALAAELRRPVQPRFPPAKQSSAVSTGGTTGDDPHPHTCSPGAKHDV